MSSAVSVHTEREPEDEIGTSYSILDIKESNKFSNHNLIIFLSHGPKFKKVFNTVKKNKSIIFDPFHYYS